MLIINKGESVELNRYCKRYMRVFLAIGGILFFALYSHNKISQEDIILNIQSLLSNDLVYGTHSPFRHNLYSRKEIPLPVTLSSGQLKIENVCGENVSDTAKHAEEVEILEQVVLSRFEKEDTLKKFKSILEKDLRGKISPMNLSLVSSSRNNPIRDFLSTTLQEDTIIVIPPTEQGDTQCGFHAVMNMLIIQQYLVGNFSDVYKLKNIFFQLRMIFLIQIKLCLYMIIIGLKCGVSEQWELF